MATQVLPQTSNPLVEQLRAQLPPTLQNYPIALAYLYGSAADGYTHPFSDVDIALVLPPQPPLTTYEQFKLALAIEAAIEQQLKLENVDVRIINDAPLQVQGVVVTRGILLYVQDEDFRVSYEVYTRKRYFDFQPVLTMMRNAYFKRSEDELKAKELWLTKTL